MKYHSGTHPNFRQLWQQFLTEPPSRIAVDTETVSLQDRFILGVGVAVSPDDAFYITPGDPDFPQMMKVLRDPKIEKDMHNAPYDLRVMRRCNPGLEGVHDTAIMARLACIPATLEEAADWAFFHGGKIMQVRSAKGVLTDYGAKGMDDLPPDVLAKKCCTDARATYMLRDFLQDRVDHEYYEVERAIIPMLETVSRVGIKLDQERRGELEAWYSREFSYYKAIAEGLGFNPGSAFQVGYMLAERGAMLPMTKGKAQLATDDKTLRKIKAKKAIPLAQLVLLFRRVQKQLSTYILPLAGQDRAYTTMHLDAITGRISGTSAGKDEPDRNLLNITKRADRDKPPHLRIRSMFVPDNEWFTLADDSQVEMRILAHLSQDQRILGVFASGGDIHRDTEIAIWGTDGPNRLMAKIFNFAMAYNAGAETVSDNAEIGNVALVSQWMRQWAETYPQAWAWRLQQIKDGLQAGYVETLYGRRMMLPFEQGEKHAANCAINLPIQGTAADIFKRSLLELKHLLPQFLLPIHDERMWNGRVEVPKGIEDLSPIHVPVGVKYAERWS